MLPAADAPDPALPAGEPITLRIPPWNMAVYTQAIAAALNTPQHRAIRRKYDAAWFVLGFASALLMAWLLRKYAMPANVYSITLCFVWGGLMTGVFFYLQGMARMQSMRKMHTAFMDGYEIHINPASGLIAFVTPFCQVFVERQHIRCVQKIGEHFIFMPQSTLMFYHLPQSVLVASGREAHVRQFFDGKLPA